MTSRRRFRPDSEWARLAGAVALTAGWFVLLAFTVGPVLARVSDVFWGARGP